MQKTIFQSQVTEIKDSFTETFGRGCLIKYKQPSFSQRNNFQQEKINVEKAGKHRYPQRQPNYGGGYQEHSYEKKQNREVNTSTLRNNKQFEKIDEINSKICGLIKSISASCQKKTPLEVKYDNKDRSSLQKGHKVVNSYTTSKEKNVEHVKTEKKKAQRANQQLIQSKLIDYVDYNIDKQPEKHPRGKLDWHLHSRGTLDNVHDVNQQDEDEVFVDLNDRIKKINDKITNYENKFKGTTKEKEDAKYKPLRQHKDFANVQTPFKFDDKQSTPKFTQNKMKYLLNQKENETKQVESKIIKVQSHLQGKRDNKKGLFLKPAFFNEKYNKFQAQNMKKQHLKSTEMSKIESKQSVNDKQSSQIKKYSQQESKSSIRLINDQLLSYKTQFLKEIVRQISLDQDFRHAKHMFGGIEGLYEGENTISSQKWSNLQKELKNEGFNLPLSQVKEIFMPRDDEIDPFMSVSHSHEELIHGLIYSYRSCEKNWNQNMYRNWSLWELRESKFTAENLDQSRKGLIGLQDLTFYLNTELDGNYRNRDLLLIFNRLKNNKGKGKEQDAGIRFKDLIDKLLSA